MVVEVFDHSVSPWFSHWYKPRFNSVVQAESNERSHTTGGMRRASKAGHGMSVAHDMSGFVAHDLSGLRWSPFEVPNETARDATEIRKMRFSEAYLGWSERWLRKNSI